MDVFTSSRSGSVASRGWGSDNVMTYDPDNREYLFKGRVDGTVLWLAPS